MSLPAYLIKPVQRITKYQLLLKDLLNCCEESKGEIKVCDIFLQKFKFFLELLTIFLKFQDGLDVMLNVPKKANDIMHLNMLEGCSVIKNNLIFKF